MVLARILKELNIQAKGRNAFLMGVIYAVIGIAVGFVLFPKNVGIVAVFFTSMAMMPPINNLIQQLALREGREKEVREKGLKLTELKVTGHKFSLRQLWSDHKHLILVYTLSFFGVFMVFALLVLVLPYPENNYPGIIEFYYTNEFGEKELLTTNNLFGEQVKVFGGSAADNITGSAAGDAIRDCDSKECSFIGIVQNNLWVLVVAFIISLIYGFGAIFIITWNASVWGVAFAVQAIRFAPVYGKDIFTFFGLIMLVVIPHTLIEAMTYFTGAISGGIAAQGIAKESLVSERFSQLVTQSLILLIISLILLLLAAYLEVYVIEYLIDIFWK